MNDPATQAITRATSAFAFDLYRALSAQAGNLFFSPWSVATALADAVARIQEGGMVRLDTANSLWPHAAHPLLEEYVRPPTGHLP